MQGAGDDNENKGPEPPETAPGINEGGAAGEGGSTEEEPVETPASAHAGTAWEDPYGEQDEDDEEELKKSQTNRARTWILLILGLLLGVLSGKACSGG